MTGLCDAISVLAVEPTLSTGYEDYASARSARVSRLATGQFDVLVVGGGITGAGVARDAVLRGMEVALVDRSDYAYGTSSRSSKLVHGGLRYLENMEFGLVFESLRERHIQRKLHPNLVWPMPFLFPVYAGDKPGLRFMGLGLWLYDMLALFRSHKLHRTLNASKVRELAPTLRSEGLKGGVHYYDCRTDDGRLTLANALSAERQGASVANYVSFEKPLWGDDGKVRGAVLRDQLTGQTLETACRHIVYAAGPWTDQLAESPRQGRLLRTTKGVHIVVDKALCPVDTVVVMKSPEDRRIVFAVPWGDQVYLGTTDTDFQDHPDTVQTSRDDVRYILDTTNAFFPKSELRPEHVMGTWAGLRPLIRSDAASAYQTSREHELLIDPRGITTIAGGKLTTYRSMAKEVVDCVAKTLRREFGIRSGRCRTKKQPADPELKRDHAQGQDPFEDLLWHTVGSGATWVKKRMRDMPEEKALISDDGLHNLALVSWAVLGEHAERLEDVMVRRFNLTYTDKVAFNATAHRVASHMARIMGKDSEWVATEVNGLRDTLWAWEDS